MIVLDIMLDFSIYPDTIVARADALENGHHRAANSRATFLRISFWSESPQPKIAARHSGVHHRSSVH